MTDRTKPDNRIIDNDRYKPTILGRLLDALCARNPSLPESQITYRHLATLSEAEISKALRGPGIRSEWIEEVLWDRRETLHWVRPIGERVPMKEGWDADYEDDTQFIAEKANRINEPYMGVVVAPAWLRALKTILESSDHPLAAEILAGMREDFDRADEECASFLDLTPRPPVAWVAHEGGYWIRVDASYTPMCPVYRRWDATIGIFNVSIVRVSSKPGVGAYCGYLDLDDRGEAIVWDQATFTECETELLDKLKLRVPIIPRGTVVDQPALKKPHKQSSR